LWVKESKNLRIVHGNACVDVDVDDDDDDDDDHEDED
jgi:hypothetical protein